MAEPRMTKTALFTHFAERFGIKRTEAREFFDELQQVSEQELLRCGEFMLPGIAKLVVQKRDRRMGRNPATGATVEIPGQAGRQGAHREAAQGCDRSVDARDATQRPVRAREGSNWRDLTLTQHRATG